jgi:hypothetical protein
MPSPLDNPSVTSPRQGDRSRASRVSPRNITGRTYADQHADAQARKAAEAQVLEIPRIKHDAFTKGHAAGYKAGLLDGQDVAVEALLSLSEEELLAKRAEYIAEFGKGTEDGE